MTEDKSIIAHPFLRQVEVIVGPLPEYKGGGPEGSGIRLYGDGTPNGLRIKFQVNKPWTPSHVTIYNLGPSLRAALHTKEAQLIIRAGWQNFGLIDIFKGSMLASYSSRQGPDIATDLIGYEAWFSRATAIIANTYAEGMQIREVILDLAKRLEGVTVDPKRILIKDAQVDSGGLSEPGLVRDRLDALGRTYGFNWGVNMGAFYAISHDNSFSDGSMPVISGKNGYLMRAEPMLASPTEQMTGITVTSLFNPFVLPLHLFRLESLVNPDLNGDYKAHVISHTGDTHSSQWNTEIQSWIVVNTPSVAQTQTAEWDDINLLAGTIYGEASGEPTVGKEAVGVTVRNRVQHPNSQWGGPAWKDVILRPRQFACWTLRYNDINLARQAQTPIWKECYLIAEEVYKGKTFNLGLSGTPTNFYSGSAVPSWAGQMLYIGKIGGHKFFQSPVIG